MTYENKYKKLVETIYKELSYSQRKINDKNTPPEFANFQSGKKLALEGLAYTIKQMETTNGGQNETGRFYHSPATLLYILYSYKIMIERNKNDFPGVLIDDLEKSINSVLNKNNYTALDYELKIGGKI